MKPVESSKLPASSTSASAPTAVPINKTSPAPSTSPSAASSPKSHAGSFTSLNAIQSQPDALKSSFVFPTTPQFESGAATLSGVPRSSYSSPNASVHEYENELTKLLTELDAVESDGEESIRGARKALVMAVEKELDKLDEEKRTAWRNWIVEVGAAATPSESHVALKTSSEPREDASEAESAWTAPASAAAGEEVRGYDVFEPTVEVADPALKDEDETPKPVVEASAEDPRVSAPEASEQVRAVRGQHTELDSESMDETTDLTREHRHSDSEAEPLFNVQQARPVVSEASRGGFDNIALVEETTDAALKDTHASDDEFEML